LLQGTHQWSSAAGETILRAIGGLQLSLRDVALEGLSRHGVAASQTAAAEFWGLKWWTCFDGCVTMAT